LDWFELLNLSPLSFGVGFDANVLLQLAVTNCTNRGFEAHETLLDDIGQDGTTYWTRDYETACLVLLKKYPEIANK
jgi:hypothetical protein